MSDLKTKLFCFGFGYTAAALSRRLQANGWKIAGTTRSAEKAHAMRAAGFEPCLAGADPFGESVLQDVTAVLISAPPGPEGCPALYAARAAITANAHQIKWLGYLSTNGVYGDHGGAWVDEESELKASLPRARRRIDAEKRWLDFGNSINVPTIIFRLPGIYGPGRSAIETARSGAAKRIFKPGQYFSRMHVEDIATALGASLKLENRFNIYNLADDEPAPPQDVVEYACKLLGLEPPPLVPIDEAPLSDMARSFYADNKRVSNARMKGALGVTLQYPTYREGLQAIAAAMK